MVILEITESVLDRANELYEFGALKNSITKGKSNIYGAIGEILVFDYFTGKGLEVDFNSTFDYDLIIEGHKVDVKTKHINVVPKDYYLVSISESNTKQETDFYFFVMVEKEFRAAYLLGYKEKKEYFKQANFKEKGSLDVDGFEFKGSCYNLKISQLNKFKK